jgi:hypothetical protein
LSGDAGYTVQNHVPMATWWLHGGYMTPKNKKGLLLFLSKRPSFSLAGQKIPDRKPPKFSKGM